MFTINTGDINSKSTVNMFLECVQAQESFAFDFH